MTTKLPDTATRDLFRGKRSKILGSRRDAEAQRGRASTNISAFSASLREMILYRFAAVEGCR